MRVYLFLYLSLNMLFAFSLNGASVDILKYTPDPVSASAGFISTANFNNNVWAVYNNASLLSGLDYPVVAAGYKRIFNMLNSFNFVYGLPARKGYGAIAGNFIDYGENDFITGIDLASGLPVASKTFHSYDLFVAAGYGNQGSIFNYGVTLKFLQSSIADEKMTYVSADINFMKVLDNSVVIGLNFRNLGFSVNDIDGEIPSYIALGATVPFFFINEKNGKFFFISELRYYPFKFLEQIWDSSIGLQYKYGDYSFRMGAFLDKDNPYFFNIGTVGVSYFMKQQNIRFDYALNSESFFVGMNHTLSITYYINMRIKGVRRTYKFESLATKGIEESVIKKREEKLFKEFEKEESEQETLETEEWSDD